METDVPLKSTAKDIFMHLLTTIMLYASVVSFISLLFAYVDYLYPDQLTYYLTSNLDKIRLSSSVLVVMFPVYILLSWLFGREFKVNQMKRNIRARKIFIYITLFASAITVIVDLVTLVYRFYSGDLTTQFFLKVIAILIVAAAIFGYYLWDIRRINYESKRPKLYGWLSMLVILVSVISGFFIVGSPATQRDRRFDDQRISDLQNIQSEIITYWVNKDKLPATLDDLKNNITGFVPPLDPQTSAPYKYDVKSTLTFDLCATFQTVSSSTNGNPRTIPMIYPAPYQQNWNHNKGLVCFDRTIDPQLYQNQKPYPAPLSK